jgi:hypothetical protein
MLKVNQWIDGHRFDKDFDTIDQKEKIFNRWIDIFGGQYDQ